MRLSANSWFKRSFIRGSDDGAVLIVVLGILALLTVMAVSFVFSTRLSMRASEAYMRTVTATDIAEAGAANAIYVLEADKMKRTGDPRDPTFPVTEAYDSLRDDWRRTFSAPVILTYDSENPDPEPSFDLNAAAAPITVTNYQPFDTTPQRQDVSATVIGVDTENNRLYVNSVSPALWKYQDASNRDNIRVSQGSNVFTASLSAATIKPDEEDLDGDGENDAVWHNYYDQAGNLIGRYAVLIQDEQSKINVNVAGNLANLVGTWNDYSNGWGHGANEGWSPFEISLTDGLNASATEARNITMYRSGFPPTASPGPGWTVTPGTDANRIYVPGQNDMRDNWVTPDGSTIDDDDDNYNRLLYANDGVDNDGDGTVDEETEGINEPEEFRPLRPVRLRPESGSPLEYDGTDNDSDGVTDETNEADDQPILTLEQLEADIGLSDFLTTTVTTNFDGDTSTETDYARRHFMSTLSHDRNLNRYGELRINPNFSIPEQNVAAVHAGFPPINTSDTDAFERPDLRNMQAAANIYDYRDRNNSRTEIRDTAGDVFAGVEAIRINEALVRAATNLYEAEHHLFAPSNNWGIGPSPTFEGAGSPRGYEGYLRHSTDNGTDEDSALFQYVTLPNPPFTSSGGPASDGNYPFKLRMRVRTDGSGDAGDRGFEVYVNSTTTPVSPSGATRWATLNAGNWYVEEGIVNLTTGDNYIFLRKPGGTDQDVVDVDWFYFTLEPDCEWIELVNIGDRTVNVNNWTLVSEYTKDVDQTAIVQYVSESFQLKLPDVGILPVDDPTVWSPGPPHYIVFVIDRDDEVGSSETIGNDIAFDSVWDTLAASTNVYQFASISNIYSGGIDFFGNEPLDNPLNNILDVDARDNDTSTDPSGLDNVTLNIEVGRISLYDANGNLVDQVTYDAGNTAEAFASLQRDHPANPGERLEYYIDTGPPYAEYQNFKLRAYTAGTPAPTDNRVLADGAYDDWKFWNDEEPPSPTEFGYSYFPGNQMSTPSPWPDPDYAGYSPNSRGSSGFMTPAEANNRSLSYEQRVATAESRVKDRNLAGPGELVRAPLFHEHIAVVGYDETVAGTTDDENLSVGDVIVNEDELNITTGDEQTAVILAINTTDYGVSDNRLAPSGWMVLRGDFQNPVSTWDFGDWIRDDGFNFGATISSVKLMDAYLGDEKDFYLEIEYTGESGTPPSAGDTVTNTSKDPDETALATAVDTTNKLIQLTMNEADGDPVTEWKVGDRIEYSGGGFSADILAVREKSADVRGLADYFTTAFIDLEAAAATPDKTPAVGGYTLERWPDSDTDPTVYRVNGSDSAIVTAPDLYADFVLTWNEDDGVQEGTYDLYSVVNFGSTMENETPIYVGPVTVERDSPAQQATLDLTIQNAGAAAAQYHFMRAVLAPPPQTFGRINVNTASERVLQGLRLELPDTEDSSAAWSETPTKSNYANAIIRARNIRAFESIGDVYRASEMLMQDASANDGYFFTPDVFRNISGLITARSDVYKIIVIGQAATDANNDGIIQNTEVTSEKLMEVIYQR